MEVHVDVAVMEALPAASLLVADVVGTGVLSLGQYNW